jgi:ABC-2 type transport system ATP-binding protein
VGTVIRLNNVHFEYGPHRGIYGISLDVARGECFALLGKNGSGKTTLIRLLLGQIRPMAGTVSVLGRRPDRGHRDYLKKVGVVRDSEPQWEALSGWNNAVFSARSYGMPSSAVTHRLEDLFKKGNLLEVAHEPAKTYSFGMLRKLALIQGLSHNPELLILDEPTTGIDVQFLEKLSELIREQTRHGMACWITGNDPDWIAEVAGRVAFLDKGRILVQGSVKDLIREVSPFQRIEIVLARAIDITLDPDCVGLRSLHRRGEVLTAVLDDDPKLVPDLIRWIASCGGAIKSLEVRKSTLRDAFLLKTGKTL